MRKKKLAPNVKYEPPKCWVGEQQKVCYESEEDAVSAARAIEYEHGLCAGELTVYLCEYGEHWHLAGGDRYYEARRR